MNEVILLGAGASFEAEVPMAIGMTKKIIEKFNCGRAAQSDECHIMNFVVGGLLQKAGEKGANPFEAGVDVEDLYNAVDLLAKRDDLQMSPFIGSWHSLVERFDRLAPTPPNVDALIKSFDEDFAAMLRGRGNGLGRVKQRLKAALTHREPRPGRGVKFRHAKELMVFHLLDIALIRDETKVTYLKPLVDLSKRNGRQFIATLNYDNSIELAAKGQGISCNSGIDSWSDNRKLNFDQPGLHLAKLHGSINWRWFRGDDNASSFTGRSIRTVEDKEPIPEPRSYTYQVSEPALVFGHENKLTAEGPFLDLLKSFEDELNRASLLTVIGYSFRDPHINVQIGYWLNRSETNKLRIVDPHLSHLPRGLINANSRVLKEFPISKIEFVKESAGSAIERIYSRDTYV